MFMKRLVPLFIVLAVVLAGCSSGGDTASLQAEIDALKQEVAALKQQLGITTEVTSGNAESTNEGKEESSKPGTETTATGNTVVHNGVTYTFELKERTTNIADRLEAKQGNEFLIYDITILNNSNDDVDFSQNYFDLVLSTGEIKDNYLILDLNNQLDNPLSTGTLASGGKKTGWVAFEVPSGDEPLEIRYERKSLTKGTDSFKLKLR